MHIVRKVFIQGKTSINMAVDYVRLPQYICALELQRVTTVLALGDPYGKSHHQVLTIKRYAQKMSSSVK